MFVLLFFTFFFCLFLSLFRDCKCVIDSAVCSNSGCVCFVCEREIGRSRDCCAVQKTHEWKTLYIAGAWMTNICLCIVHMSHALFSPIFGDHLWLHNFCNRKSLHLRLRLRKRWARGKTRHASMNGFLFACKIHLIGSDLTRNKINNQAFFLSHNCAVFYGCTHTWVCVCVCVHW